MKKIKSLPIKYVAPIAVSIVIILIAPTILQNTPPVANAKAIPQVADIGQTIIFNATESLGGISYEWIFHDGTKKYGKIVEHSFNITGIYYVTLIVTAGNGLTDLTTVRVVIRNEKPQAKIAADLIGYEGEDILFDASQTIDSEIDMLSLKYFWDFGDGTTGEGKTITHKYSVSGVYTVTLRVEDNEGFIDMDTVCVNILNKPPTAKAEVDKVTVYEGEEVQFYGYTTDTEYENLSYLWDFGDGTYAFSKNTKHAYQKSGIYSTKFMVRDEEGEISSDTITVEVINKPPTISIKQKNIIVEEGKTIIVEADIEDTPTDIPLITYEWSNGSGGWRRPYIWPDDWSGEIWVKATDDDGATSIDEARVQVVNVDPEASIIECYAIANITFRVAGGPNATIEVKLIRDNQTIFATNITRTHCEPQNVTLLLNGKIDLTSTWIVEARYVQNYPPCGSNPAWIIMEFSNGAWRKIHHVFNPRHNETYEWRVVLNDYIIKPFPEIHECDCGCCCGYDLEYYGDPEIFFVGKGFDRGMDDLTFLWYVNDTLAMMEEHGATEYPMLAESTFPWEIGYPTNISLRVVDDDGGHSKTYTIKLLKQNTTMKVEGVAGRIEIVDYVEGIKEYEIFYATTNASENTTIVWMLDGDTLYGPGITYTWNESGTYIVKIYRNISGELAFLDAVKVEVYNAPPEILKPGEVLLDEGAPINFALSAVDTPNDQQKLRILWMFAEGFRDINITTGYVFWRSGVHIITLYAVDDNGATVAINVSVDVVNRPPTAEKKKYTATMDKSIIMRCIANDTPYDEFYPQYKWVIGGETIIDGYDIVYTFIEPGETQVKVIVMDDDGDFVETSINVTVENLPPIINIPEKIIYYGPRTPIPINTTTVDTLTHEGGVTVEWIVYYNGQAHYQDHQTRIDVEVTGEYMIVITAIDPTGATTQKTITMQVTLDNDGDGLTNEMEEQLETDPNAPDTDGDYLLDPEEIELGKDGYVTDPTNPDTDGDGLYDGFSFNGIVGELSKGTSPVDNDTDDDRLIDGLEVFGWDIVVVINGEEQIKHVVSNPTWVDSDSDGLNDTIEYIMGTNPSAVDTDGDGITDYDEVYVYGSSPSNSDSDEDMLMDGDEVSKGLSPINPDSDNDGLKDGLEVRCYTNPMNADTDGDGLLDGLERAPIISYEAEDFAVLPQLVTEEGGVLLPMIPWSELWHYEKLVEFYIYDIMDVVEYNRIMIPYINFIVGLNITYYTQISYNERHYLSYIAYSLRVKVIVDDKTYKDSTFEYIQWPEGYYKPYYIERFEGYMIYLPLYMCFPKIKPNMKIEIYGFRRPTMDKIYIDKVLICYPGNPLRSDLDGDGLSDGEEFWYGTSPADSDTDDDYINDLYDTNPLGNAELYVEMTKFSLNLDCVGSRSYTFNIYIVETNSISTITFYNVWPTGWCIPFDIPDDISSVRIRIDATCTCCFFDCDTYYLDLSIDKGSDFSGRTLELKVNMKYGYRFIDPTSSWDDDWTQFTTKHPINSPCQTVNVTIMDKSGYGYASGYEDGVDEQTLVQGEIWFETKIKDCDGKYWRITRSPEGSKSYTLIEIKDNLPFWLEAHYTQTSPGNVDTDGDRISDAWEDYDGDGAFNIQELMIGKNPRNPHDVIGIHLYVGSPLVLSDDEIEFVMNSIILASRYIFDYTDGHVFISKIRFVGCGYPGPPYYSNSNVWINEWESLVVGQADCGGCWENIYDGTNNSKIVLNWYWLKNAHPYTFACVVGHEIGHWVLYLGDEYHYWTGEYRYGRPVYRDYNTSEQQLFMENGLFTVMGLGKALTVDMELKQELSTYNDYRTLSNLTDKNITQQQFVWMSLGDPNMSETYVEMVNDTKYWPHLPDGSCWSSIIFAMNKPGVFLAGHPGLYFTLWFGGNVHIFTDFDQKILEYIPLEGPYTCIENYVWVIV